MSLSLKEESWIWYSLVIFVAAARFASRILLFRGDLRKLQIDDFIIALALCSYTTLIVTINIVAFTESNLLPPGFDMDSLTPPNVAERRFGSKLVLVVEQCQCVTIWAVKACLLIMYYRLTIALKENIAVKILSIYVAFGFIFMEIFYFGVWCRPFPNYWAVPTPNTQCNAATNHLITNAVFNISSDLFLLVLALQMIIRSRLPMHRKLVVSLIFGIAVFVILASILNKYYSFTNPFGGLWTYWYTRESSTSLLVANLPYTWTLLRRLFNLRSFDGRSSGTGTATENGSRFNYHSNRTARGRHASVQPSMLNGEPVSSPPSALTTPNGKLLRRSDSHTVTTRGSVDYANRRHSGAPTMGASSTLDSSRSSAARSDKLLLKTYPHNHEVYGRADQEALSVEPWDFGIDLGGSVAEEAEEEEGAYRDHTKDREKLFKDAYMDIDPARLGLDSAHREAADLREFERAMLRGDAWDEEAAIGGGEAAMAASAPVPHLSGSRPSSRPGSSDRSTTTVKSPSSPTKSLLKE
ncbi:family decarboxylase [Diplodia corticola]|uniref:Family decarboxylase n=1 Tax=Diplodia corticola TaxID=236234 RepID=A0A1J9QTL8_9PEZI|nr:family decarboxylase [Diplodia corticola]OJD31784.1 family decarboxylase [Diplodia corticola]